MRCRLAALMVVVFMAAWISAGIPVSAQEAKPPAFEALLQEGKLAAAEQLLAKTLAEQPDDDKTRFALGVTQFVRAVETRIQVFHKYGIRTEPGTIVSFSALPIPPNPKPAPLDYKTARAVLQGWVDDLARVEATLAPIRSADVKLPLHLGLIRLDPTGTAKPGHWRSLWEIYHTFNQAANISAADAKEFVLAFDRGDVDWLRGYCHLLSALTEALLAYDFEDVFNRSGYILFGGIKAPDAFLVAPGGDGQQMVFEIMDLVALVHLIRLPVAEPQRLQAVLTHLEATVALSRSSWAAILAETDDDHEWIPNPKQKTAVPNGQTTDEMVRTWTEFLDEFGPILAGNKLVPFWRGNDRTLGLNLRRICLEPRPFDLVLWLQGTALIPYLEVGDVTKPETWSRFNRIFRGQFIGFALWYN